MFEQLLTWASDRPLWQREALRRIALHGDLGDDDFAELHLLIAGEAGIAIDRIVQALPLAANHLTEAGSNAPRTVLTSLGPVHHVDRLASDEPPIRFAVNGITLIYGPNGSGKSGYCRVAKQLCRALHRDELRGSVYEHASALPEVAVSFRVGDDGEPKVDQVWRQGDPPPPDLARISVFDAASARIYVDRERKLEFLPYELDLLNKLGAACKILDQEYKRRVEELDSAIRTPLPTGYIDGTQVQQLLAALAPSTPLEHLPPEAQLRGLAAWSDADQVEFDSLTHRLQEDPDTMIRLRRDAQRILEITEVEIERVRRDLGDAAVEMLRRMQKDAAVKEEAAQASAKNLFKNEPIPDVGSEAWRQMLFYARQFAAEIYYDCEAPQLSTGGQCVLCQQDLNGDAADRMARFEDYINRRATKEAAHAKSEFQRAIGSMQALSVKSKPEISAMLAGYAAFDQTSKQHSDTIVDFFEQADKRLATIKRLLREESYLENIDPFPDCPRQIVADGLAKLDREIGELVALGHDEDARRRLENASTILKDRRKLGSEIEIIVKRRNELEERHRILICRGQCRTASITSQITTRRREILTPSLQKALRDEIEGLGLTHIPLSLSDRGDLGDSIVEVGLLSQQRVSRNSDILSEGEQRGVALACFLAELLEIGSNHGIIVDDPISSLDHVRMEAVAGRLVKEAQNGRQVIVFTHNILFHHMLSTQARRAHIARHDVWMASLGKNRFGVIDDSKKPSQMKGVHERLDDVDQAFYTLKGASYDHTDEAYHDDVVELYVKMRMTWERAVEEVVFNKAVQRFRPEIMTQRLSEVCFDAEQDYPSIFEGMKRCSHYSGHDRAEGLPPELPILSDIAQDIKDLHAFVAQAKARQRRLRGVIGAYEDGPAPVLL